MNTDELINQLEPLVGYFVAAVWEGQNQVGLSCRAQRCTSVRQFEPRGDAPVSFYSDDGIIIVDEEYGEFIYVEPVDIQWISETCLEITEKDETIMRIYKLERAE